jgi:hypothetical protein
LAFSSVPDAIATESQHWYLEYGEKKGLEYKHFNWPKSQNGFTMESKHISYSQLRPKWSHENKYSIHLNKHVILLKKRACKQWHRCSNSVLTIVKLIFICCIVHTNSLLASHQVWSFALGGVSWKWSWDIVKL